MLCCITVIFCNTNETVSRPRLASGKFMSATLCFTHSVVLMLSAVFDLREVLIFSCFFLGGAVSVEGNVLGTLSTVITVFCPVN